MRILLDTNILLRLSEKSSPHHLIARAALKRLAEDGYTFSIASQSIAEFLAVASRSVADRGLGLTPADSDSQLASLTLTVETLYDSPMILRELRRLVTTYQVIGKSVHDAKLVAVMQVNDIEEILTFNGRDFTRYKAITIVEPQNIAPR
jgi:predicted nucleic acid-binding protein